MDLAIWLMLVGRILGADVADPSHGGPLGPRSAVAIAAGGTVLVVATVGVVAYGVYASRGRMVASIDALGSGPQRKPEMPVLAVEPPAFQNTNAAPAAGTSPSTGAWRAPRRPSAS